MRELRCFQVDLKTHSVIIKHKVNHPPHLHEAGCVSHRENTSTFEAEQDLLDLLFLRGRNKQNLTSPCLWHTLRVCELNPVTVYGLIYNELFKIASERIVAEYTDLQGTVNAGKCVARPFYELGEVVQKSRFDLIFRGRL